MSSDRHYPELNESNLEIVAKIYEADVGYFDDPECPYSKSTKDIFKGKRKYADFDSHNPPDQLPDSDDLITQINYLSQELKDYGASISGNVESTASDKNTYFRLSVTLLDKLIELKEKTVKIKEYEVFSSAVLDAMERDMTPDQRQVIMTRLQELVEDKKKIETTGSKTNEDSTHT